MTPPITGTTRLNNHLQAKGLLTAVTWVEIRIGPEHAPSWQCECQVNGKSLGIGTGTTKQKARSSAAEKAVEQLEENDSG